MSGSAGMEWDCGGDFAVDGVREWVWLNGLRAEMDGGNEM